MKRLLRNSMTALVAAICIYGVVWLYDSSLRDPQFLTGWLLFGGMFLQLVLHVRKQFPGLSFGRAASWLQMHIYGGYLMVIVFAFHTGVSLPDGLFEWIMWTLFVIVSVSGVAGTYLTWSIPSRLEHFQQRVSFEMMPSARFDLAQRLDRLAIQSVHMQGARSISELYTTSLRDFFSEPRNILGHLRNSRRPLNRLFGKINNVERYVDQSGRETLYAMKDLVYKKDQLDYQYAHQWVLQTWLFVHIPATHCLIISSIVHVMVVYAYSAGVP